MWQMYKKYEGKTPSRETIENLAAELGLKENQIYKWFWDTKKKVDEDNELALQIGKKLSGEGFTAYANRTVVQGEDGLKNRMTPQQIKTALKINQMAAERETEFELIARQLGLDIEAQA